MTQEIDTYEDFDARVEKFLRKQMTEAEEQQFKDELANDADKKSRARAMALMASQMRDIRRNQEAAAIQQMSDMGETEFRKILEMQNQKHSDNNAQPNSEFRILHSALIRRISVAACMIGVLTIGGIQYNAYNRTTALGDTYYHLISSDISSQRGDLDAQSVANLTSLFSMVEKGENLDQAIATLSKLYEESNVGRGFPSRQSKNNSEFRILHWLSLSAADHGSALTQYRQTIAWNLAIAHLKDGNRNAAKEVLTTIIAENAPDKAITQSASKLLSEIADIPSLW